MNGPSTIPPSSPNESPVTSALPASLPASEPLASEPTTAKTEAVSADGAGNPKPARPTFDPLIRGMWSVWCKQPMKWRFFGLPATILSGLVLGAWRTAIGVLLVAAIVALAIAGLDPPDSVWAGENLSGIVMAMHLGGTWWELDTGMWLVWVIAWCMISGIIAAEMAVVARLVAGAESAATATAADGKSPVPLPGFFSMWRHALGLRHAAVSLIMAGVPAIGVTLIARNQPETALVGFSLIIFSFAMAGNWISACVGIPTAGAPRRWWQPFAQMGRGMWQLPWAARWRMTVLLTLALLIVGIAMGVIWPLIDGMGKWQAVIAVVVVSAVSIVGLNAMRVWLWLRPETNPSRLVRFAHAHETGPAVGAEATALGEPSLRDRQLRNFATAADRPTWRQLIVWRFVPVLLVAAGSVGWLHWLVFEPFPLDTAYREHAEKTYINAPPTGFQRDYFADWGNQIENLEAPNVRIITSDSGERTRLQYGDLPPAELIAQMQRVFATVGAAEWAKAQAQPAFRPWQQGSDEMPGFALLNLLPPRLIAVADDPAKLAQEVRECTHFIRYLLSNGRLIEMLVGNVAAVRVLHTTIGIVVAHRGRISDAQLAEIDRALAELIAVLPPVEPAIVREWLWTFEELDEFTEKFASSGGIGWSHLVIAIDQAPHARTQTLAPTPLREMESDIGISNAEWAARLGQHPTRLVGQATGLDLWRLRTAGGIDGWGILFGYAESIAEGRAVTTWIRLARIVVRIEAYFAATGRWPADLPSLREFPTSAEWAANPPLEIADDWVADGAPYRFEFFPAALRWIGEGAYRHTVSASLAKELRDATFRWPEGETDARVIIKAVAAHAGFGLAGPMFDDGTAADPDDEDAGDDGGRGDGEDDSAQSSMTVPPLPSGPGISLVQVLDHIGHSLGWRFVRDEQRILVLPFHEWLAPLRPDDYRYPYFDPALSLFHPGYRVRSVGVLMRVPAQFEVNLPPFDLAPTGLPPSVPTTATQGVPRDSFSGR